MHTSIVLMSVLRVLWMSTHGCFATSFPIPDCCDQTTEPRSQTPPQMLTTRRVPEARTTGLSQPTRS